jgi:tetratricopeptide (TPR) repeat protein
LFNLARDFLEKRMPLQAIKCVQAVAEAQPSFIPLVDVEAKANLALLLMLYSQNVREAKGHLEQALRIAQDLPVSLSFTGNVVSLLSTCLGILNASQQQKKLLERGADLVSTAQQYGNEDNEERLAWYLFFKTRLVELVVAEGDVGSALYVATTTNQHLAKSGVQDPIYLLQAHLTCLQLNLFCGDYGAASGLIEISRRLFKDCSLKVEQAKSSSGTMLNAYELGVYMFLLIGIHDLRTGTIQELEGSLKSAKMLLSQMKINHIKTHFMPLEFLDALYYLLLSIASRHVMNYDQEKTSTAKALSRLETIKSAPASPMVSSSRSESNCLMLKYLLSEVFVISQLSQCNIADASEGIMRSIRLFEQCPAMLKVVESSVHLLIGSLMLLSGNYHSAGLHFKTATLKPLDTYQQNLAKLQFCLCSLENDHMSKSEALQTVQILAPTFEKDHRGYPAYLLCKIALASLGNDRSEAKRLVQEALKAAYKKADNQVVVLCLIEYSSILLGEGDLSQVGESIDSAKTLAASVRHLPSLIHGLDFSNKHANADQQNQHLLNVILEKWGRKVTNETDKSANPAFEYLQKWNVPIA